MSSCPVCGGTKYAPDYIGDCINPCTCWQKPHIYPMQTTTFVPADPLMTNEELAAAIDIAYQHARYQDSECGFRKHLAALLEIQLERAKK